MLPLCGVDEDLARNLESFYRLDYATYEMIFSFASAEDPAYAIARRVADRHPEVPSLFVFDAREPGGNAKVNRLAAGLRQARHRLVLFSDGNVRVRPDFLRRAVSWFADPAVGLVSHLFRASGAVSLASRIESLYLNGCLQGGTALLAGVLRMPCVVGKSILVSRLALEAIGGIGVLREFLAEDFLMGRRVRRAGYRVVLSADFLDTAEVRKTAGEIALAAWIVRPLALRDVALLPVRDLAAAAVFWAGLTGKWVAWRGRPLRIGRETLILDRPKAV